MTMPFRLPYSATADRAELLALMRNKRLAIDLAADALAAYLLAQTEEDRKAAALTLTAHIAKYLTIELDAVIEGLERPEQPADTLIYEPTPEEFMRAQETVEALETQVAAMKTHAGKMPEEMRAFAGLALVAIEGQLRDATAFRDRLQSQIELAQRRRADAGVQSDHAADTSEPQT